MTALPHHHRVDMDAETRTTPSYDPLMRGTSTRSWRRSPTSTRRTSPSAWTGDTSIAKAIIERIEAIESDLGGADALSHARRSLVCRVAWLEAIIEKHLSSDWQPVQGIDLGGQTQGSIRCWGSIAVGLVPPPAAGERARVPESQQPPE